MSLASEANLFRDKVKKIFERIVLRCGTSLRQMARRSDRSLVWIWRQLRRNTNLEIAKVAETLLTLEVPLRYFLEEAADAAPAFDPAWALSHLRGEGSRQDPFLAAVEERFRRLVELPAAVTPGRRRHREIDALDEKRLVDIEASKTALETLAGELLAAAEASAVTCRGVPRALLGDGARLLLAWGEVQRAKGFPEDAIDASLLASWLAEAAADAQARGMFYLQGSRLLLDLQEPGQALRFAREACGVFQWERQGRLLPQALVQVSFALAALQRPREARIQAISALRLAGRTDWRVRTSAWLQLASLAIARGDYRRALAIFGRAKKHARVDSLWALVEWREAVVLGRLGRVLEANLAFRAALAILEMHHQFLGAAWVAADHLELFLRSGRLQEALALVKATSPCFEHLGCEGKAFELWMDLCALIFVGGARAGSRSLARVAVIREALAEIRPESGLDKNFAFDRHGASEQRLPRREIR